MSRITINSPAPDFELADYTGKRIHLSDFRGRIVLLVFNRGFTWPFCRKHLAQLRQDFTEFKKRNAVILVIGPENANVFDRYFQQHSLPFIGLPDPIHTVLKKYGQEIKIFKFGRMPAQVLVDQNGIARFIHYGHDMTDIPKNSEILGLIDELKG